MDLRDLLAIRAVLEYKVKWVQEACLVSKANKENVVPVDRGVPPVLKVTVDQWD